ncbi:MAG: 2Fe-2S iron-sulfur cluster binding domain-containing protein [Gammaproteobacteria bacterium]|nr:2Fe-2S iron-sulfur cluster binding domain-containing protein [Gammaproteobacteria bacterium]
MPNIKVTDLEGQEKSVDTAANSNLMEALVDADYDDIEAICGGCCACATCHVYVGKEWFDRVGPRGDDELMLLESVDGFREDASRLSCQIQLSDEIDGLELEIAPPE